MMKLTILRGVSGSGKSTWARQQNAVVVSRDDLRVSLYGSDGPDYYAVDKSLLRAREDYITKVEHAAIKSALLSGQDVISDNTHTMMKYVNAVAKIGWAVGAEVEVKVFDVSLHRALVCVAQRATAGGRHVPTEAIKRQHDQLAGSKNAVPIPPPEIMPYNGTPGKPKAFMYDLDGTIYHMNDKRGPYDHNVDVDDPDEVVIEIVNTIALASDYVAIAMSGRVNATRNLTLASLERDCVQVNQLFMREDGDMRADNIVKAELFDKHVRDNYDVQFVLDDRDQVVTMWRGMGLTCLQVAPGDF